MHHLSDSVLRAQAKAGGPVGANEPAANAAAAAAEQVGPPDLMRKPPLPVAPGSTPMMVSTMEARWRSKLQGQSFSVEEMIERGMIGGEASVGGNNDSPASSYHAYSGSPRRALDTVSLVCCNVCVVSTKPAPKGACHAGHFPRHRVVCSGTWLAGGSAWMSTRTACMQAHGGFFLVCRASRARPLLRCNTWRAPLCSSAFHSLHR